MENKYKYLIKNTGILTISSFSSKILVFLLVPIYTSVLTTAEYGSYELVVTTIQLLMPILSVNIYDAVMRYMMETEKSPKEICSIGLKYVLISLAIFSILVLTNWQFNIFTTLKKYSLFVILYYTFNLLNQFMIQLGKGVEKVRDIAIAGVINTVVTLILNIVLLLQFKCGLVGFYIAYISGQAVSALYLFFKVKVWKYITFNWEKQSEKEMLRYSMPLILGTLGWWCNNVSDRYVVTLICGITVNGIYSVAYKIPTILVTIQQIFMQAWQISAIKEYTDSESQKFYGKAFATLNILMCSLCMFLILIVKPLAKILYAKDFYEAWRYIPFLLVSGVFNSASGILGPILNANKDSKSLGLSSIYGAIINLVLNVIMVSFIGAQGAAIATAISSYAIYAFRKRAAGDRIEFFRYRKHIFSWGLIVCQSIVAICINNYIFQIVLIILFVLSNWQEIVVLYKNVKSIAKK